MPLKRLRALDFLDLKFYLCLEFLNFVQKENSASTGPPPERRPQAIPHEPEEGEFPQCSEEDTAHQPRERMMDSRSASQWWTKPLGKSWKARRLQGPDREEGCHREVVTGFSKALHLTLWSMRPP